MQDQSMPCALLCSHCTFDNNSKCLGRLQKKACWCPDSSSRLSKRFFVMCSFCFSPLILTDNAGVRLSLIQQSKHKVDSAWSIHIVSNNLVLSCFLYLQAASSIYGQTDRCESALYPTMCIPYYLHTSSFFTCGSHGCKLKTVPKYKY